jgi:hypothetical protein
MGVRLVVNDDTYVFLPSIRLGSETTIRMILQQQLVAVGINNGY